MPWSYNVYNVLVNTLETMCVFALCFFNSTDKNIPVTFHNVVSVLYIHHPYLVLSNITLSLEAAPVC